MIYTIDQLRAITVPIAASYGVKRLSLFGSYARGEATETSDIDILVDRGSIPGGWTIGGLYEDLCAALGKELDMITTTCPDRPFLARIKSDEVTLYES